MRSVHLMHVEYEGILKKLLMFSYNLYIWSHTEADSLPCKSVWAGYLLILILH